MYDNTQTKNITDSPPDGGFVEITYATPTDRPPEPWKLHLATPTDRPPEPW